MITTRIAFGICAFSLIGVGMVAAVVRVQPATSDLERLSRHSTDRIQQAFKAAALVPASTPVMLPLLRKGDRDPIGCANELQTES